MANRFKIETVFKMIDKISAPISKIQKRLGKFTRAAKRGMTNLNRSVKKLSTSLKRMASTGTVALIGLGAALSNVITTGADFGRAIGSAAAKFPEQIKRGTKEFKALENAARDVGSTTEFTATQAAQGLNFLAKAGFSAESSIKSLRAIVDFATASEIELAEAADIASDALGAFGLDSDDADKKLIGLERVMDVMSKTANSANTSVAELFESMKKGGPVSTVAGASIETFSAMMGFLAANGIKASEAGTASKNVTLALAGVGNKAAATFKKLGISLRTENDELRDQVDVLDDLRESLSTVKGDKVGIIKSIFGNLSIAAASKLVGKAGVKVRELRIELEKTGGSSKRTAAFIRNDVKGSIDGLFSAIEGVKISIFSLNEGPLKNAIDSMTNWIRVNEKFIAGELGDFLLMILNNLPQIVTWIKNIAIGMAIFFTFSTVIGTLTSAITLLNVVIAANPISLMIIGIAALVAAFIALVVWIDDVNLAFDNMPGIVRAILAPIGLLIKAIKFIKDNIGVLGDAANTVGAFVGDFIGGDDDDTVSKTNTNVVSPQERVAQSIKETTTNNNTEITLKAGVGTSAEITKGKPGPGLILQPTGVQ